MKYYRKAVEEYIEDPTETTLAQMRVARFGIPNLDHHSLRADESWRTNRYDSLRWMPYVKQYVRKHPDCSAHDIYRDVIDQRNVHINDISMYLALHYLVVIGALTCDNCFYQVPSQGFHDKYHFKPRRWWQRKWSPPKGDQVL